MQPCLAEAVAVAGHQNGSVGERAAVKDMLSSEGGGGGIGGQSPKARMVEVTGQFEVIADGRFAGPEGKALDDWDGATISVAGRVIGLEVGIGDAMGGAKGLDGLIFFPEKGTPFRQHHRAVVKEPALDERLVDSFQPVAVPVADDAMGPWASFVPPDPGAGGLSAHFGEQVAGEGRAFEAFAEVVNEEFVGMEFSLASWLVGTAAQKKSGVRVVLQNVLNVGIEIPGRRKKRFSSDGITPPEERGGPFPRLFRRKFPFRRRQEKDVGSVSKEAGGLASEHRWAATGDGAVGDEGNGLTVDDDDRLSILDTDFRFRHGGGSVFGRGQGVGSSTAGSAGRAPIPAMSHANSLPQRRIVNPFCVSSGQIHLCAKVGLAEEINNRRFHWRREDRRCREDRRARLCLPLRHYPAAPLFRRNYRPFLHFHHCPHR